MSEERSVIAVAGHICLDIIPNLDNYSSDLKSSFIPGKLIAVGEATLSAGGVVSNTGLALHRLGIPTRLMGKVGNDYLGRITQEILRNYDPNLTEGMIVASGEDSSYTLVFNPPGIDRTFFHFPGQNDSLEAADIPYNRLGDVGVFHFGYPPVLRRMYLEGGRELAGLLKGVKAEGVSTSLDMAMPDPNSEAGQVDWVALLERVLPYTDLFLPSLEETLFMLERETYQRLQQASPGGDVIQQIDGALLSRLGRQLLRMGAGVVGLKLGNQGLYVRTTNDLPRLTALAGGALANTESWEDRELLAPCFQVAVVGTTGAGDCSNAGFLAGLIKGLPIERVMTGAVAVGALSVENATPASNLPHWEAIQVRVRSGWEQKPTSISLPGWRWDAKMRLWVGPGGHTG